RDLLLGAFRGSLAVSRGSLQLHLAGEARERRGSGGCLEAAGQRLVPGLPGHEPLEETLAVAQGEVPLVPARIGEAHRAVSGVDGRDRVALAEGRAARAFGRRHVDGHGARPLPFVLRELELDGGWALGAFVAAGEAGPVVR